MAVAGLDQVPWVAEALSRGEPPSLPGEVWELLDDPGLSPPATDTIGERTARLRARLSTWTERGGA